MATDKHLRAGASKHPASSEAQYADCTGVINDKVAGTLGPGGGIAFIIITNVCFGAEVKAGTNIVEVVCTETVIGTENKRVY